MILILLIVIGAELSDNHDKNKEKKTKWEKAYYEQQRSMVRAFQNQQKEYEEQCTKYEKQINDLKSQLDDVKDSKTIYDSKIIICDVKFKDYGKKRGTFRPAEVLVCTYQIINRTAKKIKQNETSYYLLRFYWPNGGYRYFYKKETQEQLLYKLELNKYIPCIDSLDNKYEAMLTLKTEMWGKRKLNEKIKNNDLKKAKVKNKNTK